MVYEIIPSDKYRPLPFTEQDVYHSVKDAVLQFHGDFGLAAVQATLSGIQRTFNIPWGDFLKKYLLSPLVILSMEEIMVGKVNNELKAFYMF